MEQSAVPPNDEFPGHSGNPLAADRILFAPPPPEIGTVLSGFSSPAKGKIDWIKWLLAIFGILFCGLFIIGYGVGRLFENYVFTMPIGLVLAVIIFWGAIPHPFCTYVGTNGLARITRKWSRLIPEVFLFTHDSTVTVQRTRMHMNGIYTGTNFSFVFTNETTGQKFGVGEDHYERGGKLPEDSVVHFGERGEESLIAYLLPLAATRLCQGESEAFLLSNGMKIEMGPHSFLIQQKEKQYEVAYVDLANVSIQNGVITLSGKGEKRGFLGFGKRGFLTVPYGTMPNAQLFFLLLQRQVALSRQGAGEAAES